MGRTQFLWVDFSYTIKFNHLFSLIATFVLVWRLYRSDVCTVQHLNQSEVLGLYPPTFLGPTFILVPFTFICSFSAKVTFSFIVHIKQQRNQRKKIKTASLKRQNRFHLSASSNLEPTMFKPRLKFFKFGFCRLRFQGDRCKSSIEISLMKGHFKYPIKSL